MMIRPLISRPSWPRGGRAARRPSFRSCPFSAPFASHRASARRLPWRTVLARAAHLRPRCPQAPSGGADLALSRLAPCHLLAVTRRVLAERGGASPMRLLFPPDVECCRSPLSPSRLHVRSTPRAWSRTGTVPPGVEKTWSLAPGMEDRVETGIAPEIVSAGSRGGDEEAARR